MDEAKKADLRVEMEDQAERLLELAGKVFLDTVGAVIRGDKRIVFRTTTTTDGLGRNSTTDRELLVLDKAPAKFSERCDAAGIPPAEDAPARVKSCDFCNNPRDEAATRANGLWDVCVEHGEGPPAEPAQILAEEYIPEVPPAIEEPAPAPEPVAAYRRRKYGDDGLDEPVF